MSTDFRLRRLIPAADLFGGRLEKHGVREKIFNGTTEHSRWLTDGTNCIWVDISERGFVAMLTRYGDNDPNAILGAVDKEFDADIIGEHEMDYAEFWEDYEGEVVSIPMWKFEVVD
jgi:hypothetical protein